MKDDIYGRCSDGSIGEENHLALLYEEMKIKDARYKNSGCVATPMTDDEAESIYPAINHEHFTHSIEVIGLFARNTFYDIDDLVSKYNKGMKGKEFSRKRVIREIIWVFGYSPYEFILTDDLNKFVFVVNDKKTDELVLDLSLNNREDKTKLLYAGGRFFIEHLEEFIKINTDFNVKIKVDFKVKVKV